MRLLFPVGGLWFLLFACSPTPASPVADAAAANCVALFGAPNENTGLDTTQCRPVCGCATDAFAPRPWTPATLEALRALTQLDPPTLRTADPYAAAAPSPVAPETVCAARFEGERSYRMETWPTAAAATAAGAIVSHSGACGACSSLADLAVYAGTPDLTAPVRQCGLSNFGRFDGLVACLAGLGFTPACAQVWAYNTEHTRMACGAICLPLLTAPYHLPDGGLNACLACDETRSGAVFKSVAGRTRRNSGLANAMCRPCSEVVRLTHAYPGV